MTSNTVNALLVMPGDESATKIVKVGRRTSQNSTFRKDCYKHINCTLIERWPYSAKLERIYFDDDHIYHYEIWVDEEGSPYCKDRKYNPCATITAHPLGEARGRHIHGPAIILRITGNDPMKVKLHKDGFTLDDWKKMSQATWYNEALVEVNCGELSTTDYKKFKGSYKEHDPNQDGFNSQGFQEFCENLKKESEKKSKGKKKNSKKKKSGKRKRKELKWMEGSNLEESFSSGDDGGRKKKKRKKKRRKKKLIIDDDD